MSYSPMSFTTATAGRAGFVRLGTGVGGQSDGTIVTTSVPNGVTTNGSYADPSWITSLAKSKVGLGSVENTALSTWGGSSNITTVGTLTGGSASASFVGLGNVTNESKATMFSNPTFTSSAAGRITFNGTATIATGNAVNFGPNAYSALVETGNNDIAFVHGAYHVKGTLNSWIGATPAYYATAFVMGVEQQVAGKKFVWRSSLGDQTGQSVTWNNVMYIDNNDNLYAGTIYSNNKEVPWMSNWTSWTPTVSGIGLGSVSTAVYKRIGDLFHFYVTLTSDAGTNGYFEIPYGGQSWECGTWVYRTPTNPYPTAHGAWQTGGPSNARIYFSPLTASSMGPGEIFIFSGTIRAV